MDMNILRQLSEIAEKFSLTSTSNLIKSIVFFAAILLIFVGAVLLFFSKYSNSAVAKKIKESATVKIMISMISGLIAWFLPWTSLKMLFFSIAIVALFSVFMVKRKVSAFKAILVGLLALFVVAGIVAVPVFNYYTNVIVDHSVAPEISFNFPFGMPDSKNKVLPDSEMPIEHINHITIDVISDIELELTNDDVLHYPSRLTVEEADGNLTISEPYRTNDTYVIKMGTAALRSVDIHCGGIKIRGNGSFKDFSLNCAGASINSKISSENNIRIDCAGLDISGRMEGKTLDIDSVGTDINGELNFNKIQISSTGANIVIKSTFDRFDINSTGLSGTIEILNPQAQSAELYVQATGGNLTVHNKNNAPIEIESTGLVKIIRK
ncbi:hypothetical protein [Caldicoprobacter faecalis]|uniref:Adhesin n=1 Tax=Caldicoprobacter faecalis TaxID=937334 RepID=A0A1I5XVG6_9FIRM|nr:hypothetical protein [Caldicoprobacter faecalis]SFQ35904.1 hypothetical protein SAMN05444406_13116 [Caldicoprobacter faecalis]